MGRRTTPGPAAGSALANTLLRSARPHGVAVSTRAFHARSGGSIPPGGTGVADARLGRGKSGEVGARDAEPTGDIRAPDGDPLGAGGAAGTCDGPHDRNGPHLP